LKVSSISASAVYWNGGDAVRTRFFDALSILLSQGEAFVVRAAEDAATPAVKHSIGVQGLIDDELAHQRAHRQDQRRLLLQRGPAADLLRRAQAVLVPLHGQPLASRIALAAAFEYLTVLLARRVLHGRRTWLTPSAVPAARLWRWHCEQEIAHGHVMLALALQHRIGWGRRIACYLLAGAYLVSDVSSFMWVFLNHDRQVRGVSGWRLVRELCGAVGVVLAAGPALLRGGLAYLGPLRKLAAAGAQPELRLNTRTFG
jgi:uncharacterized protein